MKNIIREVVAVSKTAVLISVIIVAVAGAAIAYIYWPRAPEATMAVIGPEGGVVEITDSQSSLCGLRLDIPEGVFQEETNISIRNLPKSKVNSILSAQKFTSAPKHVLGGFVVESDGFVFDVPIRVSVPIDPLSTDGGIPVQAKVLPDEGMYWLEPTDLVYKPDEGKVDITIRDFSVHAVVELEEFLKQNPGDGGLTQAASNEDCRKGRIKVESDMKDFSRGGGCQIVNDIVKITFLDCPGEPTEYASLYEATPECGPESTLTIEVEPPTTLLFPCTTETLRAHVEYNGKEVALPIRWFNPAGNIVAEVDQNGVVTGLRDGTTEILAVSPFPQFYGTAEITVVGWVCSVEVRPSPKTICVGETLPLTAMPKDVDRNTPPKDAFGNIVEGLTATWRSSDDSVATVDPNGLVTGISSGEVKIIARVEDVEGYASITVEEEPEPTEPEEPDEKPESGDKYEITWKATTSVYGESFRISGIGYRYHETWEAIEVFEGYAEIIYEGYNPETNKTSRVTDFWVNGLFEQYEYQEPLNMEYMYQPGCRRIKYNITEEGAEYIKNFLEERFFIATDKCIYIFVYLFDDESKDYSFFGRRYAEEYMSDLYTNHTHLIENNCTDLKYQWIGAGKYRKFPDMGNPGIICFDETRQTYFKTIDIAEPDRLLPYWVNYTTPYVHWEIEVKPLNEPADLSVGSLIDIQMDTSIHRNIDVDKAYNMITSSTNPNVVVLDVRTQNEFNSGHISGAVWIPVTELEARIGELAVHENQEVIVYCGSGVRSLTASEILRSHGFTKVINMVGGISAWQSAGYTLNPKIVSSSLPLWTQWWFWATKLSGTIALIGVVYLLKKRKPPMPKIHSLIESYAKHQNTYSEIRNDTINQQEIGNLTIGEFREK